MEESDPYLVDATPGIKDPKRKQTAND
jgi:hypothetical protein